MPVDSVEASGEFATARHTVHIPAGVIEAGRVAAMRITVAGMRGGQPLLRFRSNWYCSTDIEPAWELKDSGWRVLIEGDTPMAIDIDFPVTPEQYSDVSPNLTAHRPVNAVPFICAATPGIRKTSRPSPDYRQSGVSSLAMNLLAYYGNPIMPSLRTFFSQ